MILNREKGNNEATCDGMDRNSFYKQSQSIKLTRVPHLAMQCRGIDIEKSKSQSQLFE